MVKEKVLPPKKIRALRLSYDFYFKRCFLVSLVIGELRGHGFSDFYQMQKEVLFHHEACSRLRSFALIRSTA